MLRAKHLASIITCTVRRVPPKPVKKRDAYRVRYIKSDSLFLSRVTFPSNARSFEQPPAAIRSTGKFDRGRFEECNSGSCGGIDFRFGLRVDVRWGRLC